MEDNGIKYNETVDLIPVSQDNQELNISNDTNKNLVETPSIDNSKYDHNSLEKDTADVELTNDYYEKIVHTSIKRVTDYIVQSDYFFRVCVVGDSSVGKTSLLTRYCDNVFKANYTNTIGVDFRVVSMKYKDRLARVHIWDTAGQERFRSISINYFRSCHGFFFIYDITNKNSFLNINKWIDIAFSNNKMSVVNFLVGNKNDKEESRQVSVEEAKEYANLRNLVYLETSAKINSNVDKAFEYMTFKLIDYYTRHKKDYRSDKGDERINGKDIKTTPDINKKNCKC